MAGMAAAGAAGAAVFLYYAGWGPRDMWPSKILQKTRLFKQQQGRELEEGAEAGTERSSPHLGRASSRPARPPSTWGEAISTLSETLRFAYAETLGKWPLVDLAVGVSYLTRKQGYTDAEAVFGGEGSIRQEGPGAVEQVEELLRLLNICIMFKRTLPVFLANTGFKEDQLLMREGTAGLLRPAFVVIRDDEHQTILLIIRGTYSMKDTLTSLTGARVPFHHTVMTDEGTSHSAQVNKCVLGYAHCGMAAAARWIAQKAGPLLLSTLKKYPKYRLKIVGHSMGGATGALLSYILREKPGFEFTHCVAFAPAACMTWDLSVSGESHVVSVVNGFDLVPTFSVGSADDLRAEVTASAWLSDFRDAMERVRVLRMLMGGAAALRGGLVNLGHIPSQLGRAGQMLRPVTAGTQALTRRASSVAAAVVRGSVLGWSCTGLRQRVAPPPPGQEPLLEAPAGTSGKVEKEDTVLMDAEPMEMRRWEAEAQVLPRVGPLSTSHSTHSSGTPRRSGYQSREDVNGLAEILNDVGRQEARKQGGADSDSEDEGIGPEEEEEGGYAEGRLENYGGLGDDQQRMAEELRKALEAEVQRQREEIGPEVVDELLHQSEENGSRGVGSRGRRAESIAEAAGVGPDVRQADHWLKEETRFFPPGRVLHMVKVKQKTDQEEAQPSIATGVAAHLAGDSGAWLAGIEKSHSEQRAPVKEDDASSASPPKKPSGERVALYETDKTMYGHIWLSRTMVLDHYMPKYNATLKLLLASLQTENDESRDQ